MTAEDIGHDSLALTWKAPVWDGGSNITNYLVEKREHPMSSWIRVGNTRWSPVVFVFSYFNNVLLNSVTITIRIYCGKAFNFSLQYVV